MYRSLLRNTCMQHIHGMYTDRRPDAHFGCFYTNASTIVRNPKNSALREICECARDNNFKNTTPPYRWACFANPSTNTIARPMPPLKAGPLERGLGTTSDMASCCSTMSSAQNLEFLMHFIKLFARKRDSASSSQSHTIAALVFEVRGEPWTHSAKHGRDCPGHKTLSFSVVERFPGTARDCAMPVEYRIVSKRLPDGVRHFSPPGQNRARLTRAEAHARISWCAWAAREAPARSLGRSMPSRSSSPILLPLGL